MHNAYDSQLGAIYSEAKTGATVFKHSAEIRMDAVTSEYTTTEVLVRKR